MAKLKGRPKSIDETLIPRIYELYDTGEYGYLRIAKMLGVTKNQVHYYVKLRIKQDNKSNE